MHRNKLLELEVFWDAMPCRLAKLPTFRAFIFKVNRCKKKQLQKFQRIVVPPSSESSIPSRIKYERFKDPCNVSERRPA